MDLGIILFGSTAFPGCPALPGFFGAAASWIDLWFMLINLKTVLFIPQGNDRVQTRGFPRRIKAKHDADRHGDRKGRDDGAQG